MTNTQSAPAATDHRNAPASQPLMVETCALRKAFGGRQVLRDLDLRIERGAFVALVGPNGVGKTTLLRVLATLSRPTSGRVWVDGLDVARQGADARRRIGLLSHRTFLYEDLTAEENLRFFARLYDLPHGPEDVLQALRRVGLGSRRHDLVRTFSQGMQQRLALTRALLHRPELLLLDEPFAALDVQATGLFADLLDELRQQRCTVLLATHHLERALSLAQRVVVLGHGRVVYDQPTAEVDGEAFAALYLQLTA